MTREEKMAELTEHIRQGEAYQAQGYDCDMFLAIDYALLGKLLNEEPEADTLLGQARNMKDALAEFRQEIVKALRINRLMDWLARKLRRS